MCTLPRNRPGVPARHTAALLTPTLHTSVLSCNPHQQVQRLLNTLVVDTEIAEMELKVRQRKRRSNGKQQPVQHQHQQKGAVPSRHRDGAQRTTPSSSSCHSEASHSKETRQLAA